MRTLVDSGFALSTSGVRLHRGPERGVVSSSPSVLFVSTRLVCQHLDSAPVIVAAVEEETTVAESAGWWIRTRLLRQCAEDGKPFSGNVHNNVLCHVHLWSSGGIGDTPYPEDNRSGLPDPRDTTTVFSGCGVGHHRGVDVSSSGGAESVSWTS